MLIVGWKRGREVRDWMRNIPHLKELPMALAAYFMENEGITEQEKRESKTQLNTCRPRLGIR